MHNAEDTIVRAGFILQLDCPDLALGRHTQFAHMSLEEFRKVCEMHVEVLNYAVADIAPDCMRMHICWASTGGVPAGSWWPAPILATSTSGTFAGRVQVDTNIVWHKLRSLVEGARLASEELW